MAKQITKEVPTLVKILAVLEYIGCAFLFILGVIMFMAMVYQDALLSFFGSLNPSLGLVLGMYSAAFSVLFIVLGIIFMGFAVLAFFVGRGLWKGQNWARILVIVFSAIAAVMGILSIISGDFTGIASLMINGLIGWYMWFNEDVKAAFA